MTFRSRLVCASCNRSVPRAAARCPWCSSPVDPFGHGGLAGGQRPVGDNGDIQPSAATPERRQPERS